jgi:hypothetical protein
MEGLERRIDPDVRRLNTTADPAVASEYGINACRVCKQPGTEVLFAPKRNFYVKSAVLAGNRDPYKQDPTGFHFQIRDTADFSVRNRISVKPTGRYWWDVGDPPQPTSVSEDIVTVSGRTCETLAQSQAVIPMKRDECAGHLSRTNYYDRLANRKPDDPRNGNTNWHKFYAWTFFHGSVGQPVPKKLQNVPTPRTESRGAARFS